MSNFAKTTLRLTVSFLCLWPLLAANLPNTQPSFEAYAVNQLNAVLDHILHSSRIFVVKVLTTENTGEDDIVLDRDRLKNYVNRLAIVLHGEEDQQLPYQASQRKFNFLNSGRLKQLQDYIPEKAIGQWNQERQEIMAWLNKQIDEMRMQFEQYTSEEPLRHQYFNDRLDDIVGMSGLTRKLNALNELTKTIVTHREITLIDLYM